MKNILFLIIVLLFTAFGCEDDNQNYPALADKVSRYMRYI